MSATNNWKVNLDPAVQKQLMDACGHCDRLPVMERTVQRVLVLTANDEADTGELVSVLEGDPDLAANILRYANSAHASRPIRSKTVRQAVTMSGRRAIRQLCLEAVTFRFFESAPGNGRISRGQLHLHAVSVANLAAAAARLSGASPEAPHLAGLLHDCGKLVMPLAFGEDAMDEVAALCPSGAARSEAEWDRFGADHAYAGALLAEQAGLDEELVAAIAWHHGGRRGCAVPSTDIACVQLADAVAGMLAGQEPDQTLLRETLSQLGLDETALDTLAVSATDGAPDPAGPSPAIELSARLAKLEALVGIDELTGLANRRAWMTRVREALQDGENGQVMLADLDHFKLINDTHGHSTGDLVLSEVARVLDRHGIAGRIGGDEFALWAPGTSGPQAAQRVVAEVADRFAGELDVGVSVGLAPAGIASLTDALEAADRALYAAKAAGRGRACAA